MDSISTAAQHLYNNIIAMAGTKIVTIAADERVQSFDLHGSEIGYHPSHRRKFMKLLNDAVKRGGGVIIRQFTDVRIRCETPHGIMDLPIKNVCGVMCFAETYAPLSPEEVRSAAETDAGSGAALPSESAVNYVQCPFL